MAIGRPTPWFAFLVHPRDVTDVRRLRGAGVLEQYSMDEEEFLARALSSPPWVIGEVRFGSNPARGELIGVPCMPENVMRAAGRALVAKAAGLAVQRGARVIGLGGLTSPATRGGSLLLPGLRSGFTVTTGNAYTAVVARDNVLEACASLPLHRQPTVAVVGCTGSVGAAATRLLADEDLQLILVGRSEFRVRETLSDVLDERMTVCSDIVGVAEADVVLLLTSDPSARLRPLIFERCDRGVIVIDVAQPANVTPLLYPEFERLGVAVVEGGVVDVPGLSCTYDLGLPGNSTFACLAETYLFAREGIAQHSVGPASVDLARVLERAAQRRGLTTRPLASVEGPRTESSVVGQAPPVGAAGRR